jgi:hypothetical protein
MGAGFIMTLVVTTGCRGCAERVAALRAGGAAVDVLVLPGVVWTLDTCARCCPTPPNDSVTGVERMERDVRGRRIRNGEPFMTKKPIAASRRRPGRPTPIVPKPGTTTSGPPVPAFLRRMIVKGSR